MRGPVRYGSAEIEMLVACIILLGLLLLLGATLTTGAARLSVTEQAEFLAFQNATEQGVPQYTNDPAAQPLDGIATIRPTLPNRVQSPHPTQVASGATSSNGATFRVTVGGHAAVASPTWAYSAYPVGASDQAMLQSWFEQYVQESHADIAQPLGLSPAWQP